MCFGAPKPPTPPTPPPPPAPPPAQPMTISPPTPPPVGPQMPGQATGVESAQLKAGGSGPESAKRAREGARRLRKKTPAKTSTKKVPTTKGQGQGLSYSGNLSGSGSSLNINK